MQYGLSLNYRQDDQGLSAYSVPISHALWNGNSGSLGGIDLNRSMNLHSHLEDDKIMQDISQVSDIINSRILDVLNSAGMDSLHLNKDSFLNAWRYSTVSLKQKEEFYLGAIEIIDILIGNTGVLGRLSQLGINGIKCDNINHLKKLEEFLSRLFKKSPDYFLINLMHEFNIQDEMELKKRFSELVDIEVKPCDENNSQFDEVAEMREIIKMAFRQGDENVPNNMNASQKINDGNLGFDYILTLKKKSQIGKRKDVSAICVGGFGDINPTIDTSVWYGRMVGIHPLYQGLGLGGIFFKKVASHL